MLKRILSTVVVAAAIAVLPGCKAESQQKVLKLAHGLDVKHSLHVGLVFMGERLEELSGGKMSVDIYPGAQLGSEPQCIELVQIGSLAMTKVSSASLEGFVEEYKAFGIPYVLRSQEHNYAVLDGEVGQELLTVTEKYLFRGLGFYDAGARSFYTMKKPVLTPDDLVGQKMRVMKSPVAVAMMQAFGGSATPIAYGELFTALQSGVVDGAENNLPSFVTSHHYEVAKHYSFNEHTMTPDVLIISTNVWNKLSPEEQGWLSQAVKESIVYQRKLWAEQEKESIEIAEKSGVTFYYPDKKPFMDKVADMKLSYKDNERVWNVIVKFDAVAEEIERKAAEAEAAAANTDNGEIIEETL